MNVPAAPDSDAGEDGVAMGDDPARLRRRLERERAARSQAEQIAELVTRELYRRQQELALLFEVARAANECRHVRDALALAVDRMCEVTGWPVGHVFLAGADGRLRSSGVWHATPPERFEEFHRVTQATVLRDGEGLGGRVMAGGEPLWLPDVTTEASFLRAGGPQEIVVRAGCGFPILVGSDVAGVIEFFSDAVLPCDERMVELGRQVATELGRAIERERAAADQSELHDALARHAAELERSNEELQQFASIASHDLQEPLRKVRTFNQRVLDTEAESLSEQGQDSLRRANAAAGRMQTLVEDLLRYSRVSTRGRPFAPVDLDRLTAEVIDDLGDAVERSGATVRVGSLPTIDADALQMRQLLQNLLHNAIKFSRDGVAAEVSIDARLRDGALDLVVSDNGIGFEPRYRDRIFRVFERLHGRSEYDGTGIGLALCRKIAERHGGTVWADGTPGVGSTFTVTVPLSHAPVAGAVTREPVGVSG